MDSDFVCAGFYWGQQPDASLHLETFLAKSEKIFLPFPRKSCGSRSGHAKGMSMLGWYFERNGHNKSTSLSVQFRDVALL